MKTARFAFKSSLPILFGYLSVGFTFGLICSASGYAWYTALFACIVLFAGAAQFVGVDIFAKGGGIFEAFYLTLFMNLRHIAYSISMLDQYQPSKYRLYLYYTLSDETFAVVSAVEVPPDIDRDQFYLLLSALNQSYWTTGTMLGVFAAGLIPFSTKGMDFALTSLFVVSFMSQWEQTKQHTPALLGLISGFVMLMFFGASNMMAPALALMLALLFLLRRRIENAGGEACAS